MNQFTTSIHENTIHLANELNGVYDKSVTFHCFWKGNLTEKQLYSIYSCYFFNVFNKQHKIILWLENNTPNDFNERISKYCEIKQFSLQHEQNESEICKDYHFNFQGVAWYSDIVRYLLLYNYGGCWFDLDCLFLRCFDPIFNHYENEVCVYQWGGEPYPNNAIFISLTPKSVKMKKNIEFIIHRNRGWGFQEAQLTYDLPLDMLTMKAPTIGANAIHQAQ